MVYYLEDTILLLTNFQVRGIERCDAGQYKTVWYRSQCPSTNVGEQLVKSNKIYI